MWGGLIQGGVSHSHCPYGLRPANSPLDKTTPHAVVLSVEDLSKAYNRGSHQLVVEDLHSMHLPGWILAILSSYLSERSMVLSNQKAESTQRPLPGGFPAGTYLGGILFIVKFNGACLRPPIPRPLTENKAIQLKYIDD